MFMWQKKNEQIFDRDLNRTISCHSIMKENYFLEKLYSLIMC